MSVVRENIFEIKWTNILEPVIRPSSIIAHAILQYINIYSNNRLHENRVKHFPIMKYI